MGKAKQASLTLLTLTFHTQPDGPVLYVIALHAIEDLGLKRTTMTMTVAGSWIQALGRPLDCGSLPENPRGRSASPSIHSSRGPQNVNHHQDKSPSLNPGLTPSKSPACFRWWFPTQCPRFQTGTSAHSGREKGRRCKTRDHGHLTQIHAIATRRKLPSSVPFFFSLVGHTSHRCLL
ncbi:hypothetical protein B0T11DRAFT_125040 [Plectosphaerella cucumerina]|uniref:Uncharacterized protein n=1 Tax=Plectosphaerella cucumerina TaxID=40658 RepID=A0A8K0X226_9PEZI|nr:hypothetical protein B0T11DRAFT_125040 [Plectosphaerella cucumerina]